MAFPDDMFGKCPVCGGGGIDAVDPGPAFSTEDHAGEGYELEWYDGVLMCQMCRKRYVQYEETKVRVAQNNEQDEWWQSVGVKKQVDRT